MKNRAIEFWRFLFTIFVVLGHLGASIGILYTPVFENGGYAVEFFFLLSGFLMMMSFEKNENEYMEHPWKSSLQMTWKKIKRFAPIYYICFFVLLFYKIRINVLYNSYDLKQIIGLIDSGWKELFFLNGFNEDIQINGATWYISALLIVGALVWVIIAIERKKLKNLRLVSILLVIYSYYYAYISHSVVIPTKALRALFGLLFGSLIYNVYKYISLKSAEHKTAFIILGEIISFVGIFYFMFTPGGGAQKYIILFFALFILCVFCNESYLTAKLDNNFSVFLGKISYPIYVSHLLIISKFSWEPGFDLSKSTFMSKCIIVAACIVTGVILSYMDDFLRDKGAIKRFIADINIKFEVINNIDKKTKLILNINICVIIMMLYCVLGFNVSNLHYHWYTNIFYLCLYFLIIEIVYFALRKSLIEIKYWSKAQKISAVVIIILACVVQIFFVRVFIHAERDIKTWDSTVYWIKDIQVSEQMYGNIGGALTNVSDSIKTQEYNNLASVFAAPIIFYYGNSFLKFICSNYLFFYVPFCLSLALYIMRLTKKESKKGNIFVASFLICLISVTLFRPLIDGYLDVIGLFIISLLLHATYDWDYKQINIRKNIFLAGLSLLLLFSRRWYAFFIVGFYFAFGVEFAIDQMRQREIKVHDWKNFIANIVMIAGVSCLFILIFFPEVFTLLFNNYGDAYSSYKTRTAAGDLWYYIKDLGILTTIFCSAGLVLGLKDDWKEKERKPILLLLVCAIVTFALFQRVQSMGEHHRYLMLPVILVSEGYLVIKFSERKKGFIPNLIVLGVCMVNFLVAFVQVNINESWHLLTQVRRYPVVRNDFDEINQIVDVLVRETKDTNKKIYIAVDSELFSQELLKRAKLPDIIDAMPNIIGANIKDTRDGFPSQCFLADYIVTAPTLYNDQKIISEITRLLQEDNLYWEYYTMIDEIYIAEDVPICIFRKNKPLDIEVVRKLSNCLKEYYDNDFVTEADYFVSMINIINANSFEYNSWDNGIYLDKAEMQEIIFEYQLNKKIDSIQFNICNWYPNVRLLIYMDDELQYNEELPYDGNSIYQFDTINKNKITIKVIGDPYASVYLTDGVLK